MAAPSCRCHLNRLCCPAPSRSISSLARLLSQTSAPMKAPITREAKFTCRQTHRLPPHASARYECRHEFVSFKFKLGDQHATLCKVSTADKVQGIVFDFLARYSRADNIYEHNRQRDPISASPFLEAPRARLTFIDQAHSFGIRASPSRQRSTRWILSIPSQAISSACSITIICNFPFVLMMPADRA